MRVLFGCFVTAAIWFALPSPAISKEDDGDLAKALERYVTGDDAAKAEALVVLKRHDAIPKEDVKKWIQKVGDLIRKRPRRAEGVTATLQHDRFPIKYALIGDAKGKKRPLLVSLHGGGPVASENEGAWRDDQRFWKNDDIPLVAVPRVFDDTSQLGWDIESGVVSVIAMIDEIKRSHDIDTNRIYLVGISMGSWGALNIGTAEADRFAAISPQSGGYLPTRARLANLLHTPVALRIGAKDTRFQRLKLSQQVKSELDKMRGAYPDGYKLNYKEVPGQGHGIPAGDRRDVLPWMARFTRDPCPKRVIWEPLWPHKKYFHWIKIDAPDPKMRIEAEVGKDNLVTVTTRDVARFTLFFNDKLVNLAKPVKIEVNKSVKFEGMLQPSMLAVVESYTAREDAEMIFTSRVEIGE